MSIKQTKVKLVMLCTVGTCTHTNAHFCNVQSLSLGHSSLPVLISPQLEKGKVKYITSIIPFSFSCNDSLVLSNGVSPFLFASDTMAPF